MHHSPCCSRFSACVLTRTCLRTKGIDCLSLSHYHKVNTDIIFGTKYEYDLEKNATTMTLGGQYSYDKQTTFHSKIDTTGQLSTIVERVFANPEWRLSLSASHNVTTRDASSRSFGIGLTFGDLSE
jgi:hypothetical protein